MRKHRLKKLERALSAREPCLECGWGDPDIEIVVWWEDIDGAEPPPGFENFPEKTTYCGTCGQPDQIVVEWGDADRLEEWDRHQSERLRAAARGDLIEIEAFRETRL